MLNLSGRSRLRFRWWYPLLVLVAGAATPSLAQDTRAGTIEKQIAEKADQLQRYEPGKLERALLYIEGDNILRRVFGRHEGWYPRLGGLSTGSGFAIGPGYRNYFGRDGLVDIWGAASFKGYRALEGHLITPSFADDRLALTTTVSYLNYPQERYFGLGIDASAADRVSYGHESASVGAGVLLWPRSSLNGGFRFSYTQPTIASGTGTFPSIETVFSPAEAPGVVTHPAFQTTEVFLQADYRDFPGNPRSGGVHRVVLSRYRDRDVRAFTFNRLDIEAIQFFPFLDRRRVIALRARASLTDAEEGNDVPFYLMPFVGGPETLRGYRERRFTDRNLVLLQAEYRYEVLAALDMALFIDAATVAPRARDLALREMKTDYGLGFRFGTRANLMLRFDIGFGGEGTRYFLKFGPVF